MKKFIVLTLICFLVAGTAKANFFLSSTYDFVPVIAGGGGSACDGLDTTVTGVVMDLDATCENSYDGSGSVWSNLAATGASYNFDLINAPTFTGTAGDKGAYFAHDGTNYFQITSGNTDFIKNMSKTGAGGEDFTFCWKGLVPAGQDTTSGLFGTRNSLSIGTAAWIRGNNQLVQYLQDQGSVTNTLSDTAVTRGASNYTCVGHNQSTNTTTYWVNTTTGVDLSQTYNTGTTDPVYNMALAAIGSAQFPFQNGFQSKSFVLIDKYATNAEIADIVNAWAARHD